MGCGQNGLDRLARSELAGMTDKVVEPGSAESPAGALARLLGEVTFLMIKSEHHRNLFLSDLEWAVMPPVGMAQFRLYRDGDEPKAFVSWGYLSEEAEQHLLSSGRIRAQDWRSGDRPWVIGLVTPFGGAEHVVGHLIQGPFAGVGFKILAPGGGGQALTVSAAGEVVIDEAARTLAARLGVEMDGADLPAGGK